jgi:predicted Zn-dependent protease
MSVDLKEEIARYRELLRRDPRSRVFAPLAEACRREGRLEEALALARAGVGNHPAYAGGRLALGRVLLDMGRVPEAAEELGRAIAAAPGGASGWRLLGEARARLRDRSGAFEAFARALALDPLDDTARRAVLDIDSLIAAFPAPEVPSEARADTS